MGLLSSQKILVVAAHPDDEILGCGGTINRLSQSGAKVNILILGEGLTSRQEKREPSIIAKEIKKLHSEVAKAGKIVGAKSTQVTNFPDNRFDSVPLLDIVKIIESLKRQIRPDTILTHHPGDLNIDHQRCFYAVMTASRPIKGESVKQIYSFEVPSSTEWQAQLPSSVFCPNTFVSLTKVQVKRKIAAMEAYSSEKRSFPHPRSPKALWNLASHRGINVGTEYAEAFELHRAIL